MKSTQAWGWLAAGVLALGLNGVYHDAGAGVLHRAFDRVVGRVAHRTELVLALASGRAEWFMAKTAVAQNEIPSPRWQGAVADVQSKVAQAQSGCARLQVLSAKEEAREARREAELARLEANRERIEARLATLHIPDVQVDIPHLHLDINDRIACSRIHMNASGESLINVSW
jgi:hypothetical protein